VVWNAAGSIRVGFHGSALLENFCIFNVCAQSFSAGIGVWVAGGFFEEIGWMGFAFPRMRRYWGPFASAAVLGVLWGAWHLSVIDFLGAATPHGAYLVPFFLAFTAAMTAMRELIAFVYTQTKSVPLTQLMHASSTSALTVLSPPGVSPAQEVAWYVVYGAALWVVVAAVMRRGFGD
jgi:membrane protease YdiL (CAAX protease family)